MEMELELKIITIFNYLNLKIRNQFKDKYNKELQTKPNTFIVLI